MTGILAGESTLALCAVSLAAGPVLGGFYDIFRIRRVAARELIGADSKKHRRIAEGIVIFAEDILFALVSAVIFSVIFYRFSCGAVRWYALACTSVSFAAYRVTVGRLVMGIAGRIIAFVRRTWAFAVRVLKALLGTLRKILHRFVVIPLSALMSAAWSAAVYPVYKRRSAQLTAHFANDALSGFENGGNARTLQRSHSKWIKRKTKPKNRPTRDE